MDRIKVFGPILSKFETEEMRLYCIDMIQKIPDYIMTMPSSTLFKYHNKTQCQAHGQVFHILMFGEIMNYVLGLEYMKNKYASPKQRDCLRCTSIFHDAVKCGWSGSQYTVHEHPMLAAEWVRGTIVEHDIDEQTKNYIARLCESHSGQWTSSNRSRVVLPQPENDEQFLVHMCDYLSSRSNLDMTYSDDVLKALDEFQEQTECVPDIETYVLGFGKHRGKTLPEVLKDDPGYIEWAKENITREPVRTLLSKI